MEMSQGVRDRIFAAADVIYAEQDRRSFPTVDAVRKRARVNMNDASAGMKEWRRSQTATANPVPAQLPAELQGSCLAALTCLWKEATNLANENLRIAQVGWEAERAEAEELSRQMAAAYDAQVGELDAAQLELTTLKTQIASLINDLAGMRSAMELAERDRAAASSNAKESTVRALEIERRANDLQQALEYTRQEVTRANAGMEAMRAKYSEQLERVRQDARHDLEGERAKLEREREQYREATRAEIEAMRVTHIEQLDRVRNEARRDVENERAKLERDCDRYQEAAAQALAQAARLEGRLDAIESGAGAKPAAKRTKPSPSGAASGDGPVV